MTLLLAALLTGCVPAWHLDDDTVRVERQLNLLDNNRFVPTCAPREWALVQANQEFARTDLRQGDGNRAREHLDLALHWADAALEKAKACDPGDSDGDGLHDDQDQCPQAAEDFDGDRDADGCPDVDSDGDGLEDDVDQCPEQAEDLDGFKDGDGCPEPDNDGDGILDERDKCPLQAEIVNEYLDEDGCPDTKPEKVIISKKKIEILDKVNFALNAATIDPGSYGLLDQVAQVMTDAPELVVRVEGHTDNQGNDSFNLKLSQARAESVRTYLEGRGVDAARLEAVGYGETRPIDTNRTEEGRAANRRVEFTILRSASGPVPSGD